ncbi:DNA primase [Vulcanococcus sp.]|uniref:DNA primase n=1 Tax=Vulcanococcus sp. TaxID=2856995 RepID=UPI003C0B7314
MRLHDDTIALVRERARILDQFGDGQLKRTGREFLARCPWHDDHRPSLTVSPRTNRVFCFVCARGADSIGWLQDTQGLSFTDAILQLADRYNVEVKAADEADAERLRAESAERVRLFETRAQQLERFSSDLLFSPGLEYLQGRGLTMETIEQWQLGWNGRRVMFPLWDAQGRCIAFTGRVLDDSKPKYKNSPNDLLYQKAEQVYGLHFARDEIVRTGHVVVVEGQFDVIRCWQEGLRNLVAVSGSSLTSAMVEKIVRTTRAKKVTLCFDGDTGGLKAADRALRELQQLVLQGELELQVLSLPAGQDPADLAPDMAHLLESAPHWVKWWLEREVGQVDLTDPQQIARAESGFRRILQVLPDGALREYVRRECKARLNSMPLIPAALVRTTRQLDACLWAERRALRLYLLDEGSRPALQDVSYTDPVNQYGRDLVLAIEGMAPNQPEQLRPLFSKLLCRAPGDVRDKLMPLAWPIPEVTRVITDNPVGELEAALTVLASEACQV